MSWLLLLDNFCDAMLFHIFIFHVASDVRSEYIKKYFHTLQTKHFGNREKTKLFSKNRKKSKKEKNGSN